MEIRSYRHKGLKALAGASEPKSVKGVPSDFAKRLHRQLTFIQAASNIQQLATMPMWKIHPLEPKSGQPSILLRREITVSAALLAATVFVAARALGLDAWPAALIAAPCGFALRAGALVWGWSLPAFPGTPSRS